MRAAAKISLLVLFGMSCLPNFADLSIGGEGEGDVGEGEGDVGEGEGEGEEGEGEACVDVVEPVVDTDWILLDYDGPIGAMTTSDGTVWLASDSGGVGRLDITATTAQLDLVTSCATGGAQVASIDVAPNGRAVVVGYTGDRRCAFTLNEDGSFLAGPGVVQGSGGAGGVLGRAVFLDDDTIVSVTGTAGAPGLLRGALSAHVDGSLNVAVSQLTTTLAPGNRWGIARLRSGTVGVLDAEGKGVSVNATDAVSAEFAFVQPSGVESPRPLLISNSDGTVLGVLSVDAIGEMSSDDFIARGGTIFDRDVTPLILAPSSFNVVAGTGAADGAYALVGTDGMFLSRALGGAPLTPTPGGALLPEVIDMVVDGDGALWALHRDGALSYFAPDHVPGACNRAGVPDDVADLGFIARRLLLLDGVAWATGDQALHELIGGGGSATTGRELELPQLAGMFRRNAGEVVGVGADGDLVVLTLDDDTVLDTQASGARSGNIGQTPVVATVDGNVVVVVGYDSAGDAGNDDLAIVVSRCDLATLACNPTTLSAQRSTTPDENPPGDGPVAGVAIVGANVVVSRFAGILVVNDVGGVVDDVTFAFGNRAGVPVVVGDCAYVANAGNGTDSNRVISVDAAGLIDEATDDAGDGEVDGLVVVDGGLVGSGKSGLFSALTPGPSCTLSGNRAVGPRAGSYEWVAVTASPEGVLALDALGHLWLTHVERQ